MPKFTGAISLHSEMIVQPCIILNLRNVGGVMHLCMGVYVYNSLGFLCPFVSEVYTVQLL